MLKTTGPYDEGGRPLCYVLYNKAYHSQGMLDITLQSMHWLERHYCEVHSQFSGTLRSQSHYVNSRQQCDSCVFQGTDWKTDNQGSTDMVFTGLILISVSNNQGDQYLEPIYICSKNKNLNLTKFKPQFN